MAVSYNQILIHHDKKNSGPMQFKTLLESGSFKGSVVVTGGNSATVRKVWGQQNKLMSS